MSYAHHLKSPDPETPKQLWIKCFKFCHENSGYLVASCIAAILYCSRARVQAGHCCKPACMNASACCYGTTPGLGAIVHRLLRQTNISNDKTQTKWLSSSPYTRFM